MSYKTNILPRIKEKDFDKIAEDFLDIYYPEALVTPIRVPIKNIAKEGLHLDIQYQCLSEEFDILGEMVFSDGNVVIYNSSEGIYEEVFYKRGTMLIDPQGYKLANDGCVNNTIAHECVHWFKHRTYQAYKLITDINKAKICRCPIENLPFDKNDWTDEEWMEWQAKGISPRILLPKFMFEQKFEEINLEVHKERKDYDSYAREKVIISRLASFFDVSYTLVKIRLQECELSI